MRSAPLSLPIPLFAALTMAMPGPSDAYAGETRVSSSSSYAAFAAQEARIAAIGFRLATRNAAWCPDVQPQFGWMLGDARLYDANRRPAALAAYAAGTTDAPYIAAIAPDSPAARANLRVGMPVATVNDIAIPAADPDAPFSRIIALEQLLNSQSSANVIRIGAEAGRTVEISPVPGCIADFRLDPGKRAGAFSNDRVITVNTALADFAFDDDELASAIAHELAHNILRHHARLDEAGVGRGLGKQFGRNARLFRQTEIEADRLSAWLLAGAGYDPHAGARFWTRFGQRKGAPFIQPATHPRWRDRVAAIEAEAVAIDAARAAGHPLQPPLIAAPPPLE